MRMFFWKTLFLHPDKLPKLYFRTPYTLFVFFKTPKKHYKIGETSNKKSWTYFRRNLGKIFNSRNGKSWTDFQLHYIYIHTYIHMHTGMLHCRCLFSSVLSVCPFLCFRSLWCVYLCCYSVVLLFWGWVLVACLVCLCKTNPPPPQKKKKKQQEGKTETMLSR